MPLIPDRVIKELVNGINSQKTRKTTDKITKLTLCNFGELGLFSPEALVGGFYNEFEKDVAAAVKELREKIDKLRGEACELYDDGCKDSAGCCDPCSIVELVEELVDCVFGSTTEKRDN